MLVARGTRPWMSGLLNDFVIVPRNSPCPPTLITPVVDPKAVMIPAISRSLSCQSALRA